MEISWVGLLDANWLGEAVGWKLAGWGCWMLIGWVGL